MAGKNYFINGVTELLILSLLEERDMYVYEIVKGVEKYSDGLLAISQNTLYTSTYKLIGEGMLSEYHDEGMGRSGHCDQDLPLHAR